MQQRLLHSLAERTRFLAAVSHDLRSPITRLRLRTMYQNEGGKGVEPLLKMGWGYEQPDHPESEEVAKENNGYALADLYDANGTLLAKKGQLLDTFAHLRDDGTTASACWIYAGSWTSKGNQMANRDNSDPSGLGNTLGWAWAWPLKAMCLQRWCSGFSVLVCPATPCIWKIGRAHV